MGGGRGRLGTEWGWVVWRRSWNEAEGKKIKNSCFFIAYDCFWKPPKKWNNNRFEKYKAEVKIEPQNIHELIVLFITPKMQTSYKFPFSQLIRKHYNNYLPYCLVSNPQFCWRISQPAHSQYWQNDPRLLT